MAFKNLCILKYLMVIIFGYLASALIGISLGLIGGGGSILTVPILAYLFGVDASLATSYSLFIVGSVSLIGAYRYWKLGGLKLQTAFVFAIPSIVSSLIVRRFVLPLLPDKLLTWGDFVLTKDTLLLLILASLMVWASHSMIRQSSVPKEPQVVSRLKLISTGFAVGIVTGLLGAGGGFLIIPALMFFASLRMKQAIGTSLLIIFLNSAVTFAADVQSGVALDLQLLFTITLIAIGGMFLGVQLSKKISGEQLKPAFGWFVLVMGMYVIVKEIFL